MTKDFPFLISEARQENNWTLKTQATRENQEGASASRSHTSNDSRQASSSETSQRAQEMQRRREEAMRREAETMKRNEENRKAFLESERHKREQGVGNQSQSTANQNKAVQEVPQTNSDEIFFGSGHGFSLTKTLLSPTGLILLIAFGLLIFMKRGLRKMEKRGDMARMASKQEQLERYNLPFGQGGYLMGAMIEGGAWNLVKRMLAPVIMGKSAARTLRLSAEERLSHVLIQAGPRSGKTTGLIIPQIIEDAYSGLYNVYVVDRKSPEVINTVSKIWRDLGHRVIIFDPWTPQLTWGFEPLWGATDEQLDTIVEAHIYIPNDPNSTLSHYKKLERKLLKALFLAAQEWGKCAGAERNGQCQCRLSRCEHEEKREANPRWDCGCLCRRELCTLPAVAEILNYGWKRVRAAIEAVRPELNKYYLADFWEIQGSRLSEMFTELSSKLGLYLQKDARRAFMRSDFTLADVIEPIGKKRPKRTILIVGATQSQGDYSTVLASLMTQLLARETYRRRDMMVAAGLKWQDVVPVTAILDEFGTYQIQGIDDFVATARSAGVGVVAALQDQNQLAKWYQPHSVGPMITNFRNQIILRGCSLKVAEEVSVLCGKKVVYDDVQSYGSSSAWLRSRTVSKNEQRRPVEVPVKRPDEITHMPENRAILLGFTKPTEVELCRYFDDSNMNRQVRASESEMKSLVSVLHSYDVKGQPRPQGEIPRLRDMRINFSLLPGVMDDSALNEDARQPMRKQQEKIINAKLRDLNKLKERDSFCKETTGKFFLDLTVAEAKDFIYFLNEYREEKR